MRNRLFVSLFENNANRTVHTYYLQTAEIKTFTVLIAGQTTFDQPGKKILRTFMIIFVTLVLVKEMTIRLVPY